MACLHPIPAELVNEITAYLRPHSLTKLVRVSKKFRKFAQQALWHNVELHRQDAHHDAFGLTVHRSTPRVYLDDALRSVWSYRTVCGADLAYDRRNAKFGTAIRTLYRAAGRSQGWARLVPYVRHLCLTLTHKSSASLWNVILSLPHLATVEVIGGIGPDADGKMKAPPTVGNLRAPAAFNVRTARLRGYIPALFAPTLCEASASIITSLDLGILEGPKLWEGTAEETEFQEEMGVPLFVAPWGVLWYPMASETSLASLTHLLLCRPSDAAGPPDMSEDEDLEVRTDDNHEVEELKQ